MVLFKEVEHARKDAIWMQNEVERLQNLRNKLGKVAPENGVYLNLDALIAVHLTRYFPTGGAIHTTHQMTTWLGPLFGRAHQGVRDTIHFTLNGAVASHSGGDWSDTKYAVLIPVKAIAQRIVNLAPHDTFLIGKLKLPPEAEILGKKEDLVGKDSGKAKTIPFKERETIEEAVSRRVKEKGYPPLENDEHGLLYPPTQNGVLEKVFRVGQNYPRRNLLKWSNFEVGMQSDPLTELFGEAANNMGFRSTLHLGSIFQEIEDFMREVEVLTKKVTKKKIGNLKELLEDLRESWEKAGELLFTLGTVRDQIAELRIAKKVTLPPEEERAEEEALERIRTVLVGIKAELEKLLKEYVPRRMIHELSTSSFLTFEMTTLLLERKLIGKMNEALHEFNLHRFRKLLAKLEKAEGGLAKEYIPLREKITRLRKFIADFRDPPQKLKEASNTLELVSERMDYLTTTFENWLCKRFEELQRLVKEERWGEIGEKLNNIEKRMNETAKYIQNLDSLLPHKK